MDCIFCKIANGEIPSDKVYEDDKVLGFRDISPQAPSHIVLITKEHYNNILEIPEDARVMDHLLTAIKTIANTEGIDDSGFRVVNNCKREGGQTVDHVHFHILGKRQLMWPPG